MNMKTQATLLVRRLLLIIVITSSSLSFASENGESNADPVQDVAHAKELLDSWRGQRDILRKAAELINQAIRYDPKYPPAYKELARLYLEGGYKQHKEVGNGTKTYLLGQYRPGTLEYARRALDEALTLDPGYADGYILLGHIESLARRPDKAREALEMAESLAPANILWLDLYWAEVLLAESDYDGAILKYKTVAESDTDDAKARRTANERLVWHYGRLGDVEAVDNTFKRMLALTPEDAWLRGSYAGFLSEDLGRYDDAIEQCRKALRIMDYGIGRRLLADALYRKWAEVLATPDFLPEDAQKYFDEAYQLYPDLNEVMVYNVSNDRGENLAKALIAEGISIDATVSDGSTALQVAANNGHHEVVSYLLALGANPNVRANNGWTPLLGAADEGFLETVRLLLESGADVTAKLDNQDAVALARARGHHDVAVFIQTFKKQDEG